LPLQQHIDVYIQENIEPHRCLWPISTGS